MILDRHLEVDDQVVFHDGNALLLGVGSVDQDQRIALFLGHDDRIIGIVMFLDRTTATATLAFQL